MTEPILYEGMEISPPLNLNLVQDSENREARYGCRRFRGNPQGLPGGTTRDRITWHQGIDLVSDAPNDMREVYAVNWGLVEWIDHSNPNDQTLALRHEPSASGYYTVYRHLENLQVAVGDDLYSGQLIGQYSSTKKHLHFEWRRLSDLDPATAVFSAGNPINTVSLDPTPLLYRFEAEGWPRVRGQEIVRASHRDYRKIDRLRVVPWRVKHEIVHNAAWFFEVSREGYRGDYYYLPVAVEMPHEQLMIDVLRDAFQAKAQVKLRWRESHFFGDRSMIEDVRVKY